MSQQNQHDVVKEIKIYALAQDPIYIGTGGYTIGRVDNTIVRDPITNLPKIPGSSLAGTWRYYVVLEALKDLKDRQPSIDEVKKENGNTFSEKLVNYSWKNLTNPQDKPSGWKGFYGNQVLRLTCAGQDNAPQEELANAPSSTGHCGHCIVCKGFGFSKKDISWQGQIFFSDLNILFFPVFTMYGTKWITTSNILKELGIEKTPPTDMTKVKTKSPSTDMTKVKTKNGNEGHINLGWLYLEVKGNHSIDGTSLEKLKFENFQLKPEDIVIVHESLFSHIVNSNLEVRTSVSIDPITGAAKEGALFTSEAIPRGTIFYGSIRIFDKKAFESLSPAVKPLPSIEDLKCALKDSKHFYETLGIGGMTTRGFGRMKITFEDESCQPENQSTNQNGGDTNDQTNQS